MSYQRLSSKRSHLSSSTALCATVALVTFAWSGLAATEDTFKKQLIEKTRAHVGQAVLKVSEWSERHAVEGVPSDIVTLDQALPHVAGAGRFDHSSGSTRPLKGIDENSLKFYIDHVADLNSSKHDLVQSDTRNAQVLRWKFPARLSYRMVAGRLSHPIPRDAGAIAVAHLDLSSAIPEDRWANNEPTDLGHIEGPFTRVTMIPADPQGSAAANSVVAAFSKGSLLKSVFSDTEEAPKTTVASIEDELDRLDQLVALHTSDHPENIPGDAAGAVIAEGTSSQTGEKRVITDMHFSALSVNQDEFAPTFVERVPVEGQESKRQNGLDISSFSGMSAEEMQMAIVLIAAQEDPAVAIDYIRGGQVTKGTAQPAERTTRPGIPPISRIASGAMPDAENFSSDTTHETEARAEQITDLSEPRSLSPWRIYKNNAGEIMVSRLNASVGGLAVRPGMILGDLGRIEGVTQSGPEITVHTSSGQTLRSRSGDTRLTVSVAELNEDDGLLELLEGRD